MKTALKIAAGLFLLAGCDAALALDTNLAQRIDAEVQTAGMQSLPDLTWLQGSTPAVEVRILRNGKATALSTNVKCRMLISSNLYTGTNYAQVTNTVLTTNSTASSMWLQWPTIGTNSCPSNSNTAAAWGYLCFFEDASTGTRYWNGSGNLYIEKTTSTEADGLNWYTHAGNYLPLAGGTMAGAINMADHDIEDVDELKVVEIKPPGADSGHRIYPYGGIVSGQWQYDSNIVITGGGIIGTNQNTDYAVRMRGGRYWLQDSQWFAWDDDAGRTEKAAFSNNSFNVRAEGGIYLTVPLYLTDTNNTKKFYIDEDGRAVGDGHASILLGAGVSSNKNAIVAGDGQVSHGDGSISAASFWANGTNLLGMGFLTAATFTVAEGEENSWDGTNTLTIKTNYAAGSGFPLDANGDLAGNSLTNGFFVGDGSGLTNLTGSITNISTGLTGNGSDDPLRINSTVVTNNQADVEFGEVGARLINVGDVIVHDDVLINGDLAVVGTSSNIQWTYVDIRTQVLGGTTTSYVDKTIYSTQVAYKTIITNIVETYYSTNIVSHVSTVGGNIDYGQAGSVVLPHLTDGAESNLVGSGTWVLTNATVQLAADATLGGVNIATGTPIYSTTYITDGFNVATPAIVTDGAAYLWAESNAWWTLDVTGANTLTAAVPWVISTNGLAVGEIPALAVKVALADSETNTWSWGSILTNSVTTPTAGSTNLFMLWWNGAAWVAY